MSVSASIFIKTWKNDLQWLKYCLQSIRKFGTGFEGIVLVADESCTPKMMADFDLRGVTFVRVPDWENGYIFQQWVKLNADKYLTSDLVLFVDSDVIFYSPFSPDSFIRDGKPILLKTRYGNLEGAEAWRGITEKFVGWSVEWEWMRQMPLIYWRNSITAFRNAYHEKIQAMNQMTTREFSEFNSLGAFIDRYESDRYWISDTSEWMPEKVAKQFWSWGQLTVDVKREIEQMLK